jgi:hypothetical protein
MDLPSNVQKIAFLADYIPRKCGIATFTADLREAIAAQYLGVLCLQHEFGIFGGLLRLKDRIVLVGHYCVRSGVSTRPRRPYAVFGPDCPRARRRARERCDRGRIRFLSGSPRPPKNASFSHNSLIAYRRTWLKIIAWAAAKASSSKPSQ